MKLIKDESFIVKNIVEGKKQEIVIKKTHPSGRETKLGDVLNEIPCGIVNKDETGMGATSLELAAKRNSIIVQPIKVTASNKAIKNKDWLYIGSPTELHPETISNKIILDYCNNKEIKFKKILIVADSLLRLAQVLENSLWENYFLMIDEIDSFQTDASFRSSMETCLDIYKVFPEKKRALVSATIINFSDPDLANENTTTIKYDVPTIRNIEIIHTPDIKKSTLARIFSLITHNENEKIMIAYNSVSGCRQIAEELLFLECISKEEIAIFCSANSKLEVEDFYMELKNELLPVKVNFFTSAYFSGFDLDESYHLISVSGNKNLVHSLSEKKLKQIAGRCRRKLLSETVVYDTLPANTDLTRITKEELIAAGEKEINALKCIEKNYTSHPILKESIDSIRNLIVKHTGKDGYQYARIVVYPAKGYSISYLNIDAYLERKEVMIMTYSEKRYLQFALEEEGHNITFDEITTTNRENIFDDVDSDMEIRRRLVTKTIEIIKNSAWQLETVLKAKETHLVQKNMIRAFLKNCEYINNDQLLRYIEDASLKRDSRKLNNFLSSAYYESLDESQLYKRIVKFNLPLKREYKVGELFDIWNVIFIETGMHQSLKSKVNAVRLTRTHFRTKKLRNGNYVITGENPLKLNVIKSRIA